MKRVSLFLSLLFLASSLCAQTVIKTVEVKGREKRYVEEMVPSSDGVRLYTFGTAPEEGKKVPVVITRNPYVTGKDKREDTKPVPAEKIASRRTDIAEIFQHCRGRGCSEGKFVPYLTEREDGLALLDWVRTLPFYNGQIFLSGNSYRASVHFAYLETDPKDVVGACLAVQDCRRYNVIYRNGCFKTGLHGGWYAKNYDNKNPKRVADRDARQTDFPLIDWSGRYFGHAERTFDEPLRHNLESDPFWQGDDISSGSCFRNALLRSTMPVMLRTAFYDIYTGGVFDMWREMPAERRKNCVLIVDAYGHSSAPAPEFKGTKGEFPGGSWKQTFRKAEEEFRTWCCNPSSDPSFTGFELGKTTYYALWENRWYTEEELKDGENKVTFALGKKEVGFDYDPSRDLPDFPGSGGIGFGGMRSQPEPGFRDDVLSFVMKPLKKRLDVRGRITARLAVRSSCEDTAFYIRLSVKKDDGRWYLLRDDISTLTYRDGIYTPGEERILEYTFCDHAFRLEKGDVLRVDVSSAASCFAPHPNKAGNPNLAEDYAIAHNTVLAAKSSITLPCRR